MNTALQSAQHEWGNRQPVETDDGEAERIWIDNATEDLLRGVDVEFKRHGHPKQSVTFEQFAGAVDEHLSTLLLWTSESGSVLGRLYLAARGGWKSEGQAAAAEILNDDDKLRELARTLLEPLAEDALIAEAESAE